MTRTDALAALAQTIADRTNGVGRFNDRKVFIAPVWRAVVERPEFRTLTLGDFKKHLIEANRTGKLRLHRADLVGAMDPALVRDSEIRDRNATFHFIESTYAPSAAVWEPVSSCTAAGRELARCRKTKKKAGKKKAGKRRASGGGNTRAAAKRTR